MRKTTKLKELFAREKIFVLPGGGCALHAKIAEATGFEAAYMSGMNTCATIFGIPDAGLITLTEMVENAKRMANVIDIPLLADADQGFGNAINVKRTVSEYIMAGVAGIHIEDQIAPKRCGFVSGKELVSIEEASGKIRAAVDRRNELDPDFVIVARCDARTAHMGGLNEVIIRLNSYKAAGADVLYFEGPLTIDEIKHVRSSVAGPLIATTIEMRPIPSLEEHEELGISACLIPSLIARSGYYASWNFAEEFQKTGIDAYMELLEQQKDNPLYEFKLFDFLGFKKIKEDETKYLTKETLEKYNDSSGVYEP